MHRTLEAVADFARPYLGAVQRPGGAICNDMDLLLPSFRYAVEEVLDIMRRAGHDPFVFETWRSPERVALLVQRGTGSANSMHSHGVAADIISISRRWKASAAFWRDLQAAAEVKGLTSGATFRSRRDLPHVQAISVKQQTSFLAIPPSARESWLHARIGPVSPVFFRSPEPPPEIG